VAHDALALCRFQRSLDKCDEHIRRGMLCLRRLRCFEPLFQDVA
jgi:hypothetical protein